MVESTTLNYHWTKPEITKSASTWGKFVNDNLDAIDGLVFANQQGIVPIGAMTMFAGPNAPANWLICDGRTLDYSVTPAYQALFNVIGRVFNPALTGTQFALPNLQQKFPLGASAGANALGTSGGGSATIGVANLPPHAHPITDVAHNHGVNQWAHSHAITTAPHWHVVSTNPHSHVIHTNAHAHGSSIMRFIGGSGQPLGVHGGIEANTAFGNVDSYGDIGGSTDTAGNFGGQTDTTPSIGGSTDARTSNVSLQDSGSNLSTTQNAGSGTALPIVPSFQAINFIIRYL